jgi:hypothetical protein
MATIDENVLGPIRDPMATILGNRYVAWIEGKYPHVPKDKLVLDKASMQGFMKTLNRQELEAVIAKANKINTPAAKAILEVAHSIR